jgi:hypothetical protein
VVKAKKVQTLPTFIQVHDPRLGLLELQAKLGQDRRERRKWAFGLEVLPFPDASVDLCWRVLASVP